MGLSNDLTRVPGGAFRAPSSAPRRAARRLRWAALGVLTALLLVGCSAEEARRLGLPEGASQTTIDATANFWFWSWVAALVVGAIVWGLILWASFAYRKKNDDLPPQTRYNIPIETFYTVVPFIIIAALFYWEIRTERAVGRLAPDPSVTIDVVGQKWSWTFNYADEDVFDVGVSAAEGDQGKLATLWLPVDERVQFNLEAADVAHSFWVPAFYRKMDLLPGRTNEFQITPTEVGDYKGKCAELCGSYHSRMLFNVKIVERDEYDAHMRDLQAAGQTGQITVEDVQYANGARGELGDAPGGENSAENQGEGQGEGSNN